MKLVLVFEIPDNPYLYIFVSMNQVCKTHASLKEYFWLFCRVSDKLWILKEYPHLLLS